MLSERETASSRAQARSSAPRRPYSYPRKITRDARRNLMRRRRAEYRRQIGNEPTDWQRSTIEAMLRLEWAAEVAEHEGGLVGLREMREHRRLLEKMRSEFEASLQPKAATRTALVSKLAQRLMDPR